MICVCAVCCYLGYSDQHTLQLITISLADPSDVSLDPDKRTDPLEEEEEEEDQEEYEDVPLNLNFEASPVASQPLKKSLAILKKRLAARPPPEPSSVTPEAMIRALTDQHAKVMKAALEDSRRINKELRDQLKEERRMHQELATKRSAADAPQSSSGKKAKIIQEPVLSDRSWWTTGQYEVEDNQTDKLALDLRIKLGAINADPKVREFVIVNSPCSLLTFLYRSGCLTSRM